jgi:hypothetical protein
MALLCAYQQPTAEVLLQPVLLTPQCATPVTYMARRGERCYFSSFR